MSSYLIEQIAGISNIEVRLNTSVQSCSGNDRLQCVTFVDHDGGQEVVDAGHLFVFIGAAPLTDWLPPSLVRDASGFVVTGSASDQLVATGLRLGIWSETRTCWNPAFRASSWRATYAPSPSSESRPRWAKGRSPSPWSIATWPSSRS